MRSLDAKADEPYRRSLPDAGIGGELVKRPRPRRIFDYLGMLPAVGAIADYFGEYGALVRAAKAGRMWIAHHPVAAA